LVLLGSGFFVLAWGSTFTANGNLVSPMWLVVTYFLHTVGELCLSPVGLSSITKLAPRHLVGQMMGTWFMGSALGNLIAGQSAGLVQRMPLPELFVAAIEIDREKFQDLLHNLLIPRRVLDPIRFGGLRIDVSLEFGMRAERPQIQRFRRQHQRHRHIRLPTQRGKPQPTQKEQEVPRIRKRLLNITQHAKPIR
jgi:hypothetical protein